MSWVRATGEITVSALRSCNRLFIALLNPDYVVPTIGGAVELPIASNRIRTSVYMTPPRGISVSAGVSLSGRRVLIGPGQGKASFAYAFSGGGDLLVFDLSGESDVDFKEAPPAIKSNIRSTPVGDEPAAPGELLRSRYVPRTDVVICY